MTTNKNFRALAAFGIAALAIAAAFVLAGHPLPLAGSEGLIFGAVVQSAYSERMPAGVAGMVANGTTYDADSRICETVAGIGFGLAVGRGTADNGAVLGASAAADFLGITVRDITLVHTTPDLYARYDNMAVMTRGEMWVTVGGDVADGGDVTFNGTTGVLSSEAAGAGQFAIAGARWMTSASSGQLARVRLSGHLPSA